MLGLVESELGLGFGSVVQTPVAQMIFSSKRLATLYNNTPMVFQIDLLCSIFAGRFVPATPDRQQGLVVMFVTYDLSHHVNS